jgi:hypothetical protein
VAVVPGEGAALTIDEVRYVQQVAQRIAALVLLGPDLDANYVRVKAAAYPWPRLMPSAESDAAD